MKSRGETIEWASSRNANRSKPDDKRFRRRSGIRFPVSGSPAARIYYASTNLPSTSSILGHLGSTGNYNIGLLNESLRLRPKGVVLGTLTPG